MIVMRNVFYESRFFRIFVFLGMFISFMEIFYIVFLKIEKRVFVF